MNKVKVSDRKGMTREEQTDWLCRLRADLNNGVIFTPWNKEFTEALSSILERETNWVPVSESQPKESGKYFVTFGGTYLIGEDFYDTEEDARRDFEEPEEHIGWCSHNVIAWMPLPEPYKPESEDEE